MYYTPALGTCRDLILVIVLEAKRNGGAGFLGESALFCVATASGKIITTFLGNTVLIPSELERKTLLWLERTILPGVRRPFLEIGRQILL